MTSSDTTSVLIEPAETPGTTRIGLYRCGGKPVSSLLIHKRRMRIGSATVIMGGIGGVGTDSKHRKKGYSRQVMQRSVEWMDRERFDVSVLFGIRDFYHRWGFVTAYGGSWLTVSAAEASGCPYGPAVRPFKPADMPAILRIYNRQNRSRTCSIVRPPFPDDGFPKGSQFFTKPRIIVVTTHRGRIIGYAAIDDTHQGPGRKRATKVADRLALCEVGASDPAAYNTILAEAARQATEAEIEEVSVHLPLDHPFAVFCRQYGTTAYSTYPSSGAAMARIINVPRCVRKLRRELESRLAAAGIACGALWLETDAGSVGLYLSRDGLAIESTRRRGTPTLEIPQPLLTLGLLGARTPELVLADPQARATGKVEKLADALFRPDTPYMWTPDHF